MLSATRDMYRCAVESCPDAFRTAEARLAHLVAEHSYPPTFVLHAPTGGGRLDRGPGGWAEGKDADGWVGEEEGEDGRGEGGSWEDAGDPEDDVVYGDDGEPVGRIRL
jgi:hypothetical protein